MAALSYSFHIGSSGRTHKGDRKYGADNSCKTVKQAENAFKHNLRAFNSPDRDKSLNITLIGSDDPKTALNELKEAYKKLFDPYIQEYNRKQTRDDRKINDYLEKIEEDKKKEVAVESIIQVGDKDFWDNYDIKDRQKMTEIFKKQLELLQEKAPNYHIVNATIHYDEASPHMHIIGIPYGDNYKNGIFRQVAKNKVFNKISLTELQTELRKPILEQMQEIYGKDIKLQAKKPGRNKDLLIKDYIKAKQEINKKIENHFAESTKQVNEFLVDSAMEVLKASKNDSKTDRDINTLKKQINANMKQINELDTIFSKGKALEIAKNTINELESALIKETKKNIELTNQNIILEKTIKNNDENTILFIKKQNKEILNENENLKKENKELKYKEKIVKETFKNILPNQKKLIDKIYELSDIEKTKFYGFIIDKVESILKNLEKTIGIKFNNKEKTR